jgi:hypothetical protein
MNQLTDLLQTFDAVTWAMLLGGVYLLFSERINNFFASQNYVETLRETLPKTAPASSVSWEEAIGSCRRLMQFFADDSETHKVLADSVWPAIGKKLK